MVFRQKPSGDHVYLQIVENGWEKGRSKQGVIATVGRLDQLRQSGCWPAATSRLPWKGSSS